MESAPVFEPEIDNYAADNSFSVEHFQERQKELAKKMFSDNIIENVKGNIQNTMKPMYLTAENYITRVNTIHR